MLRHLRWFWQRRIRGFDDRELWSLDISLAEYIVPRLKAFRDVNVEHVVCPGTMHMQYYGAMDAGGEDEELNDHWANVLDIMIEGFKVVRDGEHINKESGIADRALCLMAKYYFDLWD